VYLHTLPFDFILGTLFFNGFSGQPLYDQLIFQLYNVVYTSFPIVLYALFDEEHSSEFLENNPAYYIQGMKDLLFNGKAF